MTRRDKRVIPRSKKEEKIPREGTWVRVDRPYRKRVTSKRDILIMGTEFEGTFEEDGKSTLIHIIRGQKQYAISVMETGMLEIVALSGMEGVYQIPESDEDGSLSDRTILVMAKDDSDLAIAEEEE